MLSQAADFGTSSSRPRRLVRLSGAVAEAIAREPESRSETSSGYRWTRPLVKTAIAASVAAAFFMGMQISINDPSRLPGTAEVARQAQAEDVSQPMADLAVVESGTVGAPQVDPEARLRLEEYIRSASITRDEPQKLEQLEDSPLYRLVNEIQD